MLFYVRRSPGSLCPQELLPEQALGLVRTRAEDGDVCQLLRDSSWAPCMPWTSPCEQGGQKQGHVCLPLLQLSRYQGRKPRSIGSHHMSLQNENQRPDGEKLSPLILPEMIHPTMSRVSLPSDFLALGIHKLQFDFSQFRFNSCHQQSILIYWIKEARGKNPGQECQESVCVSELIRCVALVMSLTTIALPNNKSDFQSRITWQYPTRHRDSSLNH